MHIAQEQVEDFHHAFGIAIADAPTVGDSPLVGLRFDLIFEELLEYRDACLKADIVEIADAIADLLYVVYGTAVSHGIDIEPIFNEVHRSNMSKVGGHKAPNGKWIKPDTYSPANLQPILEAQV